MKRLSFPLLLSSLLFLSACSSSSDDDAAPTPSNDDIVQVETNETVVSGVLDTDGDGLTDTFEIQQGMDPENADSNGNGINDGMDLFTSNEQPNEMQCLADETPIEETPVDDDTNLGFIDSDADGVSDAEDRFPNDPSETVDLNGDGLGDNANPFVIDTDGDGIDDDRELELGLNPNNIDTDADGVADGDDQFPNDPSASADSDGDGVPDSRDAFPNDPTETADLNGDGFGDNANPIDGTVIMGTVTDMVTGTGISDAQVSLDLINSGTQNDAVILASTDSTGSFTLVAPNNLLPSSFVLVVTSEGYRPEVVIYNNNNETSIEAQVEMVRLSSDFTVIEANPRVHHLGDNSFSGSENSQFQRSAEGITLTRNFNVNAAQANAAQISLRWVAKGIQSENTVVINGQELSITPQTNADGSFNAQSILLDVSGVLVEGGNTIDIVSSGDVVDFDDFEFVFIGLTGLN